MKKKILRVSLGLVMFMSLNSFAQKHFIPGRPVVLNLENSQKTEQFSFPEIENYNGSYQFIVKQKRDFIISTETFDKIEASRREDEDVTFSLNPYLDVFVYSKQKLKTKTYVPFNTTYTFK